MVVSLSMWTPIPQYDPNMSFPVYFEDTPNLGNSLDTYQYRGPDSLYTLSPKPQNPKLGRFLVYYKH